MCEATSSILTKINGFLRATNGSQFCLPSWGGACASMNPFLRRKMCKIGSISRRAQTSVRRGVDKYPISFSMFVIVSAVISSVLTEVSDSFRARKKEEETPQIRLPSSDGSSVQRDSIWCIRYCLTSKKTFCTDRKH